MRHVFIIGSKGIPARYGGFETFVDRLTEGQVSSDIKYHVSCMAENNKRFEYNGADCFNIKVPSIGSAKAVYYDIAALRESIKFIKENNLRGSIIYVLACRIGPFIKPFKAQLDELNIKLYVNPDGHEFLRGKWPLIIKKYWKLSESLMVKYSDLLICDSKNIEKYIREDYKTYKPNTTYLAYGAETEKSKLTDRDSTLLQWYSEKEVIAKQYYLVVGRFVPENNFEVMINEFIKSKTTKDLVLITNVSQNKFYEKLKTTTGFEADKRIKFVGTVYDQELLKKIRENAYGYIHGHEVGGTNPSLLEALATTDLNLLLDVGFNREVGEDGAIYWTKANENLAKLLSKADTLAQEVISEMSDKAKLRINDFYSWKYIVEGYEKLFLK